MIHSYKVKKVKKNNQLSLCEAPKWLAKVKRALQSKALLSVSVLTGHSVACYICSLAPLTPFNPSTMRCFAPLCSWACSLPH